MYAPIQAITLLLGYNSLISGLSHFIEDITPKTKNVSIMQSFQSIQ